jgi:predicted DCC family thiol-disulfide oxidoreductase YuxK
MNFYNPNLKILLFDGECNLCNSTVQFVIERDIKAVIKFTSLQSDVGKKIMQEFNISSLYISSIVFLQDGKVYYKSTAALKLFKNLNGLWKFTYLLIVVPKFIRDFVYDFIARNRIKWFGKAETCWVMTDDYKNRFL